MTVYELIQKLAEFPPDKEVVIDFKSNAFDTECLECNADIEVTKPEAVGYIDNIEDYPHEGFKKVHIVCEED